MGLLVRVRVSVGFAVVSDLAASGIAKYDPGDFVKGSDRA